MGAGDDQRPYILAELGAFGFRGEPLDALEDEGCERFSPLRAPVLEAESYK